MRHGEFIKVRQCDLKELYQDYKTPEAAARMGRHRNK